MRSAHDSRKLRRLCAILRRAICPLTIGINKSFFAFDGRRVILFPRAHLGFFGADSAELC
jgi:hypothetical protein